MRNRRDVVLTLLVPVVLVLVGGNQVRAALTTELTPWKGGGFGMFASPDVHDQRAVRAVASAGTADEVPLDVRSAEPLLRGAELAAFVNFRAAPTERGARRLVEVFEGLDWSFDDGAGRAVGRRGPSETGVTVRTGDRSISYELVEVAVWKMTYDRDRSEIVPENNFRTEVRLRGDP
jgi:hypothetical protein